jgi:hypothetical protein
MNTLSKQCRRKAAEEGYASLMNDTKWREVCFAFAAFERKPRWRTHDLLTGYLSQWDRGWYHHVGPDYCSIEWLEIDPDDSPKEGIRSVLESIGVPFEETDSYFRIIGYRK